MKVTFGNIENSEDHDAEADPRQELVYHSFGFSQICHQSPIKVVHWFPSSVVKRSNQDEKLWEARTSSEDAFCLRSPLCPSCRLVRPDSSSIFLALWHFDWPSLSAPFWHFSQIWSEAWPGKEMSGPGCLKTLAQILFSYYLRSTASDCVWNLSGPPRLWYFTWFGKRPHTPIPPQILSDVVKSSGCQSLASANWLIS